MSYLVPFGGVSKRLNGVFDEFEELFKEHSWSPPADVFENEDAYEIELEVPGIKKEDIDISLKRDTLTISGVKKDETKSATRRERRYGSFYRTFILPDSSNAENISAKFQDGLLRLTIKKAPERKSRKILIE